MDKQVTLIGHIFKEFSRIPPSIMSSLVTIQKDVNEEILPDCITAKPPNERGQYFVKVVGQNLPRLDGVEIKYYGKWEPDEFFGIKFVADSFSLERPLLKTAVWPLSASGYKDSYKKENLGELKKNTDEKSIFNDSVVSEAKVFIKKAEKMISIGESRFALNSIRNALECVVKKLSQESAIAFDTRETTLENMINGLLEFEVITYAEEDLMHKIRVISNQGDHVDIGEGEIPIDEAHKAMELMNELMRLIEEENRSFDFSKAYESNNVPMAHPNYYDKRRRFYGKWANCYSRNDLLQIPEYCELERIATNEEIGNVQAVKAALDIAVGFLPQKIEWNINGLINMPPYRYRGKDYSQPYAYDFRYYYWVKFACKKAAEYASVGYDLFEKKYIATALWESKVFDFHTKVGRYNFYIAGIDERYDSERRQYIYNPIYKDQRELIDEMFKWVMRDCNITQFDIIARDTFSKYQSNMKCDIISDIFEEAQEDIWRKYRFLDYCQAAYDSEINGRGIDIQPYEAEYINNDYESFGYFNIERNKRIEEGQKYTLDVLKPYTRNRFCSNYYNMVEAAIMRNREKTEAETMQNWKENNRCQYCGGEFTGIFIKKCSKCGRKMDYLDQKYTKFF